MFFGENVTEKSEVGRPDVSFSIGGKPGRIWRDIWFTGIKRSQSLAVVDDSHCTL